MEKWINKTFRRASIDMHIPDWDSRMLAQFDAERIADNLKVSHAQSHLQMCNSHSGQCLWQSRAGIPHKNMGKRDFILELATACKARDIRFIAYLSLSFDCLMYETHPEWRVVHRYPPYWLDNRAGNCCFNNPEYHAYLMDCIDELAGGNYPIDGMFFDMPFWSTTCYCPHCIRKFKAQYGEEPPTVVDFDDDLWRNFVHFREESLLTFVEDCSRRVKSHNPEYSVSHNHATVLHGWHQASPLEIARFCDYESGDFYGEPVIHSLACKVYRSLTKEPVFELATSRTRTFTDHVTVKSMPEMRSEAMISVLHSAALLLIDYVNVDGTLNAEVYKFLSRLNAEREQYEPFLGGTPIADVAIYLDKNSLYNPDQNKLDIRKMTLEQACDISSPHRDAFCGTAKMLQQLHIPYGVVTNITLDQLSGYKTVILPNVLEMTTAQAEIFRNFVDGGGTLYASGPTSLDRKTGKFLMEDVLGVCYHGTGPYRINYLKPCNFELQQAIWPQDMISQTKVLPIQVSCTGAEKLADLVEVFVDPAAGKAVGQHFGAFHSNPPALEAAGFPALTLHSFGRGRAIWSALPVESLNENTNLRCFGAIMDKILAPPVIELEAHPALELVLAEQSAKNRYLLGIINLMSPPAAPVGGKVTFHRPLKRIVQIPAMTDVAYEYTDGKTVFSIPPTDHLNMFLLEYDNDVV